MNIAIIDPDWLNRTSIGIEKHKSFNELHAKKETEIQEINKIVVKTAGDLKKNLESLKNEEKQKRSQKYQKMLEEFQKLVNKNKELLNKQKNELNEELTNFIDSISEEIDLFLKDYDFILFKQNIFYSNKKYKNITDELIVLVDKYHLKSSIADVNKESE
jgi:Skp family chaperone for outer membrane proteins